MKKTSPLNGPSFSSLSERTSRLLSKIFPFALALGCSDPDEAQPMMGSGGASSAGTGGAETGSGGMGSGGSGSGGAASGGAVSSGGSASGGDTGAGSGGAATGSGGEASGSGGMEGGGTFSITSNEIKEGMTFPEAHTCTGGGGTFNFGVSPSLQFTGIPEGTGSLAMVMVDRTLIGPSGDQEMNGYHSAIWNIPAMEHSLEVGWSNEDISGSLAINGGYLGPCPPSGEDTYEFRLYALPEASYTVNPAMGTAGTKAAMDLFEAEASEVVVLSAKYEQP